MVRANIMNAFVTTAWTFSGAQLIAPAIYSLILAALVIALEQRLKGILGGTIATLVVGAIISLAIKPGTSLLLSPLMDAVASTGHDDVYTFVDSRLKCNG